MKSVLRKIWKVTGGILKGVFLILPVVLIAYVLWTRVNSELPFLFGYSTSIVTTGSMSDVLPVGSIILSKEYQGEDLEVGQIVTYLGETGSYSGKLVTHEIKEINTDPETGRFEIVTKGTMNPSADPPIRGDMIKSTFVCKIVNLSWLFNIVKKPGGFFAVLIIPVLLIIVYETYELFRLTKKKGFDTQNEKSEKTDDNQGNADTGNDGQSGKKE